MNVVTWIGVSSTHCEFRMHFLSLATFLIVDTSPTSGLVDQVLCVLALVFNLWQKSKKAPYVKHMFHLFLSHLFCGVVCALGSGYSLTETERSYHRRSCPFKRDLGGYSI